MCSVNGWWLRWCAQISRFKFTVQRRYSLAALLFTRQYLQSLITRVHCQPLGWDFSKIKMSSCWLLCHCEFQLCLFFAPLPSNRHHRSNGDCLEGKRLNYQVSSVQYCVQQLYTMNCTHIWTELTVLWIGFCLTGPISLCLDSFLCTVCIILCLTAHCMLVYCVVL